MSTGVVESPFSGPLTPKGIVHIEQGINLLFCHRFPPGEKREEALARDLPDKIGQYIAIIECAANDPQRKAGPELAEMLRGVLKAVNDYYRKLN